QGVLLKPLRPALANAMCSFESAGKVIEYRLHAHCFSQLRTFALTASCPMPGYFAFGQCSITTINGRNLSGCEDIRDAGFLVLIYSDELSWQEFAAYCDSQL